MIIKKKSSIVNKVIRGNFRLFDFFLRENFTSTKSIKSAKTYTTEQKQKRQHFYAHKIHKKKVTYLLV